MSPYEATTFDILKLLLVAVMRFVSIIKSSY